MSAGYSASPARTTHEPATLAPLFFAGSVSFSPTSPPALDSTAPPPRSHRQADCRHSGALSEIPGSPFSVAPGAGVGGIAISGTPAQAVSGPAAALSPPSLDFGSITVGHPSATQTIALTDIGDQALAVTSVSITGATPADFTETHNCPPLLLSRANCTISLVFNPATTGARQAALTITDNAPGSPQLAQLTGIGVPSQPAVTLVPGTLSFPDTNQGTTALLLIRQTQLASSVWFSRR